MLTSAQKQEVSTLLEAMTGLPYYKKGEVLGKLGYRLNYVPNPITPGAIPITGKAGQIWLRKGKLFVEIGEGRLWYEEIAIVPLKRQ